MMRKLLVASALLLGTAAPLAAQQTPSAGDAANGFRLFVADGCTQCHGSVGQGGVGARLAPTPVPAWVIAFYIRNPTGDMPPYAASVVSDSDIRDIHAYLASVKRPRIVADIPELN